MQELLRAVMSMDALKRSKQMPFENIYTDSLTISWVISSQYSVFLCRHIDIALSPVMLSRYLS